MKALSRFIELTGITEDEALAALVSACSPPQIPAMRASWRRLDYFGRDAPTQDTLKDLFEEADYRCVECSSQLRLTVDHTNNDPTDHSPSNLQVLCFSCNRSKGKGAPRNHRHGARLDRAVIELYDASGEFPSSKQIRIHSGLTQVSRPELIAYLRRRLENEGGVG